MKKKWGLILSLFILVMLFFMIDYSCIDRNDIDIRGTITNINTHNNVTRILVEGIVEKDTNLDKGYMKITEKTKIYKEKEMIEVKVKDLKLGDKIEAKYDGPVMESYPVQGNAQYIIILE
jgi:beta-N-acetylhexosaminidase